VEIELAIERRPPSLAPAALEARRAALRDRGAALVLYTSGTSGRPKGAILTFASLIASARAQARLLGPSEPSDRWLLCMPLFHVGGLSILIRSALAGSAVVLYERFEVERVSEALEREGITHVSFVATMLTRVLEHRRARRAPESLRCVLLGGGPASSALLEQAIGLGYPIAPTYGLTEAASQVATRPPQVPVGPGEDPAAGLRPLPGVELRIVDEGRRVLGPGAVGEIEVRGPIVMAGYLDDPAASARALRDGWLSTGDLGWLDSAGGLRVLDRRADLIISGGENVYPAEVEAVLTAHPQVAEAGVVGLDDPVFGQRPYAFVVWRGEAELEVEILLRWCRDRLAAFKRPVGIQAIESLPRTASGKLIRRSLAALAAEVDVRSSTV
jgi:O-succinylbenzoic acid--CoA ligase